MDKRHKKERPADRMNQFIIECMFSKYFEEEKKIASVATAGLPRNDKVVRISQ